MAAHKANVNNSSCLCKVAKQSIGKKAEFLFKKHSRISFTKTSIKTGRFKKNIGIKSST
jgi:hypothetical protein